MSCAVLAVILVLTVDSLSAAAAIDRYGVYEATLKSVRTYADPSADVEAKVEFTAPSGKRSSADAFWDGADVWKVRFSPAETGKWRWKSECSDKENKGLHGRAGTFDCALYKGKNPLLTHGPLMLSPNRRYLVHSDGAPFFWLADTAWNGVLKAQPQDWEKYLSMRKSQGFTAVQFVSTPWRSFDKDAHGDTAFTGTNDIRINPEFFKRLDAKVAAINDQGMVASPVILWAVGPSDPGQALSEKDAIRLSRYIVARWGAYNVVWMLAGDGNYGGDRAERWRKIGREVFSEGPERPVTMHPGGRQWIADEFRREPWYSFIGYQSGHGDSAQAVKWLVEGPPTTEWSREPALPVINLEPNYEGHVAYDSKKVIDALMVRKALYRSLLVSPTAGVTYGHHGIWFWSDKAEVPKAHPNSGIALPWDQAVKSEGSESVKQLSKLFGSIKWSTLRPAQGLLATQPGAEDPQRYVTVSQSEKGDLLIAYLPVGGTVELKTERLNYPLKARWFDPRTGKRLDAGAVNNPKQQFTAPDANDWLLCVEP